MLVEQHASKYNSQLTSEATDITYIGIGYFRNWRQHMADI